MAPVTQYVFAEMLVISEHFAAGSHEWLPYSVIPAFSKQIGKHQFLRQPNQPPHSRYRKEPNHGSDYDFLRGQF